MTTVRTPEGTTYKKGHESGEIKGSSQRGKGPVELGEKGCFPAKSFSSYPLFHATIR